MIRLALAGALGRTGRCVLEAAVCDERFEIAAALTAPDDPKCGSMIQVEDQSITVSHELTAACDVLIDFTLPRGTMHWLGRCRDLKLPMVIGATGHTDDQQARIRVAAGTIPILQASNFSIGIYVLRQLAARAAEDLGPGFDLEIVEAHHRHKADAPSGTALRILDDLLAARGQSSRSQVVFGREGQTGERPAAQIGVHALRMGELVGKHEVHFSGPGETLTISHTAHSRATFATGALRGTAWLVGKRPGLYTLNDVFG